MAATGARAWMRSHPTTTAVAVGMLGFLLGAGAGGSADTGLESRLTAARDDARLARAEASDAIADLEDEIAELETRNSDLESDAAALDRRVKQMNARRPLPNLVGQFKVRGLKLESTFGWDADVEFEYSTERPGTILGQSPAVGTMMRYGAQYTLVVAMAPPKVEHVVGMWRTGAERELSRWNVVVVEQVSERPAGRVIAMSPSAGTRLMPGATITLTVAEKAPPPVTATTDTGAGCTPGYSPCLPPASDYDCSSGTGDGPEYTGYVTVTGSDPYGLDADGDGAGCES